MTDPATALAAAVGGEAWPVGGAVRDRLLGRGTRDLDAVVRTEPGAVARAVGRAAGGHAFELSERFGAWRVVARDRAWQLDLLGLEGAIEDDLARRDLTVNAIAQHVGDGRLVDPFGGERDLHESRLRMVSDGAFAADPLRVLRLCRLAAQLGFDAEGATVSAARASAPGLAGVAPERVFAELRALLCSAGALTGLALMDATGATLAVLPELAALDGVGQSGYHHLDVGGHTRAVLAETIALLADPGRVCAGDADAAALEAALGEPLANELTRGDALRFGALLHDIGKPATRAVTAGGRVTFMGHDVAGAELSSAILGRLRASERLRAHVAALARDHLRLGFLVHEAPLGRRAIYDYLHACGPVALDVTVLSVADRLATRGDDAERAIAAHRELASAMIGEALRWEAAPPRAPVRGDELIAALQRPAGPWLAVTLAELQARAWSGELSGRDAAIATARELNPPDRTQ